MSITDCKQFNAYTDQRPGLLLFLGSLLRITSTASLCRQLSRLSRVLDPSRVGSAVSGKRWGSVARDVRRGGCQGVAVPEDVGRALKTALPRIVERRT